jgi:hypothetical protein
MTIYSSNIAWMHGYNDPWALDLDRTFNWLIASGVWLTEYDDIVHFVTSEIVKLHPLPVVSNAVAPLKPQHISPVPIFMAIGIFLAFSALMFECFKSKMKSKIDKKNEKQEDTSKSEPRI